MFHKAQKPFSCSTVTKLCLIMSLVFLGLIGAIQIPELVYAQQQQQYRESTEEYRLRTAEDRLKTVEETLESLKQVKAVAEFLRWEATIIAAAFGGLTLLAIKWIVGSITSIRKDIRRRHMDNLHLLGRPLAMLLEQTHPHEAAHIRARLDTLVQESETESSSNLRVVRPGPGN